MKRILLIALIIFPLASIASEENLNQNLVRIINQINALMPLLDETKKEINPNARIQLHIEDFNGHPGLRSDLLSIRNALIDYINKPAIAPKTIKPLALDFIGR